MQNGLRHGARISEKEYERRVIALQMRMPPMPTEAEDRAHRRAELRNMVDRRLGVDFPADRFEKLWEVKEKIERRRSRLALHGFIETLLRRAPGFLENYLAKYVRKELATVLDADELDDMLGAET